MNNKIVIMVLILISLAIFTWLVDYGWTHRYGSLETYETIEPVSLAINYEAKDVALNSDGLADDSWEEIPAVKLDLEHQITERPWPTGHTPEVNVQAFHNGRDIYFRLTWQDDTANTALAVDGFTDGCAIASPLEGDAPPRSIMMGFSSPVNVWHWEAEKDAEFWSGIKPQGGKYTDFVYPFEEEEVLSPTRVELTSAVGDLLSERTGSLTPKETQIVQGRGLWDDGTWTVVFKRALTTKDSQRDCQFATGSSRVSFAIWDGDNDDRGSRKSISEWVNVTVNPMPAAGSANTRDSDGKTDTGRHKVSLLDRLKSFSLVSTAYAAQGQTVLASDDEEPRVITIIAKRFEYNPSHIKIEKGELVTLRLESLDVTHGLFLDGYGVNIKARPGLIGKATFRADKPGRFSFRCSETCGEFHPYMIGFMEVTPNSRFTMYVGSICVVFLVILGATFKGGAKNKGAEQNAGTEQ